MESPPDNPNRIRRLAIERRLEEAKREAELLKGRVQDLEAEIAQLNWDYAHLPWTPPLDVEFRRGLKGQMSRTEQMYRIVVAGAGEGTSYEEIHRQMNPPPREKLPPKWIYTGIQRLVNRGLVRHDVYIEGQRRIVATVAGESPYEKHLRGAE